MKAVFTVKSMDTTMTISIEADIHPALQRGFLGCIKESLLKWWEGSEVEYTIIVH